MAPRFIARQLAFPRGLLGQLMMRLMNLHNVSMNQYAVRQLDISPADRVLEIGFGGGVALPLLMARAAFVSGIDRSREAVERARAQYSEAVRAGRAKFEEGSVQALPFEPASFNKVLTVNTVYFWLSLDTGFREIHRTLTPGGRAVVGFLPKDRMDRMNMPPEIFTTRSPEEVAAALSAVGFSEIRLERQKSTTPWIVAVGSR